MSNKDLRAQFIEQIVAKNYTDAYALLLADIQAKNFELKELTHQFEGEAKPVSVMEYLCLHYNDHQSTDSETNDDLVRIILSLGRREYNKKTTALIFALKADYVTKYGIQLALQLLQQGADVKEKRGVQYKPLATICNEIEKDPTSKTKYDDLIKKIFDPQQEDLGLNEICAFSIDKRTSQNTDPNNLEATDPVKTRLQPLWVRLINLGYRKEIDAYNKNRAKQFERFLERKEYTEAKILLDKKPELADMPVYGALTVSDQVLNAAKRIKKDNHTKLQEMVEFLILVAKLTADVKSRPTTSNNALTLIAHCRDFDEHTDTYKSVVETMLKGGCTITKEERHRLVDLGFEKNDLVKWSITPPAPPRSRASSVVKSSRSSRASSVAPSPKSLAPSEVPLPKSEAPSVEASPRSEAPLEVISEVPLVEPSPRSRAPSITHLTRSSAANNDNAEQLAQALFNLNFTKAEILLEKENKLALQDLRFEGGLGSMSPARYLATRYPDAPWSQQGEIRGFIRDLNIAANKIQSSRQNVVYKSVQDIIEMQAKRDDTFKEKCQGLLEYIEEHENTQTTDSSPDEEQQTELVIEEVENNVAAIVQITIEECLKSILVKDKDFNLDEIITMLVKDTMNYAKTVTLDELTEIVRGIEKKLSLKDKRWSALREVVGAILNKTADHYIEEVNQVNATFKKTLFLCLTIVGAIVPLLYYFLKVKPTHDSSPLVVYEMTKGAFNELSSKELTHEEMTPRGKNTVFRKEEASTAISRRMDNFTNKYPRLISHTTEEKPEGQLKRCTFFSDENPGNAKKMFNGTLEKENFAHQGKVDVEVRCISRKGDQADRFLAKFEKLSEAEKDHVVQVLPQPVFGG